MSVLPNQTSINLRQNLFLKQSEVVIPPPEISEYTGEPFLQDDTFQIFTLPVPELIEGLYQVNIDFSIYNIVVGAETLDGAFKFSFNYNDTAVDFSNITLVPINTNNITAYASIKAIVPKSVVGGGVLTCVLTNLTGATLTSFSYASANLSFYPITTNFILT